MIYENGEIEGTGLSASVTNYDAGNTDTFDISVTLTSGSPDTIVSTISGGTSGLDPIATGAKLLGSNVSNTQL